MPTSILSNRTPHTAGRLRFARRFAIAGLCISAAIAPMSLKGADAQEAPNRDADEAAFVAMINETRAQQGVGPLVVHPELERVARGWTVKMKAAGDISHNPNLRYEVQANWRKLGENVGVGPDVKGLHDAFVKSPNHYRNLVDPAFDQVAVTIEYAGNVFYVTEQFMDTDERKQSSSTASPKPTNGAAPDQLALAKPKPKAKPAKKPAKAKPKK